MAKYRTAQKDALLAFLKENSGEALTISEMIDKMKTAEAGGKLPSESTVYRLIKELVGEGRVMRTVKGCSREFRYQLAGNEGCKGHLHMKCTVCGELLHMHDESSEKITEKILESEDFVLDTGIVLTGVCKNCLAGGNR